MKKLKDLRHVIIEEINKRNKPSVFKAIFVTGGPGSGKDIVIRKAINEFNLFELNTAQAKECLSDKHNLSKKSIDLRKESIRTRKSLIINGPADNDENILYIKEELEELGYETMMIFVNTTNNVSKERNMSLSKMMTESVRENRWNKSQTNSIEFEKLFDKFMVFDNSHNITEQMYGIVKVNQKTKLFLNYVNFNEVASNWINTNSKIDLNQKINLLFEGNNNVKEISRSIPKKNVRETGCGQHRILADNNCTACIMQRKAGQIDDVRDGDVKSNSGYAFRTQYEEKGPTIHTSAEPKETKFSKDKDKTKINRFTYTADRVGRPEGLGSTYDPRGTAGLVGGVGLGREQVEQTKLTLKKFTKPSVNFKNMNTSTGGGQEFSTAQSGTGQSDGARMGNSFVNEKKNFKTFMKSITTKEGLEGGGEIAMGVGGVLSGSGNKEGMDTYSDTNRNIQNDYSNKKKNSKGKNNV
jgi:predicted kinase